MALGVLGSQERIAVGSVGSDRNLQHGVGGSGVLGILSHEVGLAGEAEDISLATHDFSHDNALGSGTVGTLGNDELTLFADNILCAVVIALRLDECLLAIHHAGTRHLAELHHIGSFDFHNCLNLRFTFVCMTFSCLGKTQANLGAAPAREKARVTPPQRLRAPRREFRQRRQPP